MPKSLEYIIFSSDHLEREVIIPAIAARATVNGAKKTSYERFERYMIKARGTLSEGDRKKLFAELSVKPSREVSGLCKITKSYEECLRDLSSRKAQSNPNGSAVSPYRTITHNMSEYGRVTLHKTAEAVNAGDGPKISYLELLSYEELLEGCLETDAVLKFKHNGEEHEVPLKGQEESLRYLLEKASKKEASNVR